MTGPLLVGVFALDELPTRFIGMRPAILVVNTAYSQSPGEHWVGIYLGARSVDYFDSYGLPPRGERLMKFIAINDIHQNFNFNMMPLQSLHSSTCGKFAATFLFFRSIGFSTKKFVDIFSDDADSDVRALYAQIFGLGGGGICGGQKCYKYGGGL